MVIRRQSVSGKSRDRSEREPGGLAPWALHPAIAYRPPRYLTWIRGVFGVVVVTSVALICYVVYWFVMAFQLRDAVVDWIDLRRAMGDEITYAVSELGGFPESIELRLDEPRIATIVDGMPVEWWGGRLAVSMGPIPTGTLTIAASGRQRMTLGAGEAARSYEGAASALSMDVGMKGPWPTRIFLNAQGLDLRTADGADRIAAGSLDVRLRHLDPNDPDHLTPTYGLKVEGTDLAVPRTLSLPLGPDLARVTLEADLLGALDLGPVTRSFGQWRDRGGTVEVYRLEIVHGPLSIVADGTLALDGAMQPVGAMTAQVGGLFETVDRLHAAGLMKGRDAVAAKLVLGALAKRGASGGPVIVNAPLTLQDRIFYLGPVQIARVPELRWSMQGVRPRPPAVPSPAAMRPGPGRG